VTSGLPSRIERYHVAGTLGEGGFGSVYFAYTRDAFGLRIPFALKGLSRGQIGQGLDEVGRNVLHHEARLLSRIRHPNVVAVHEMFRHDNAYWLVLDYVEGASISEVLKRDWRPLGGGFLTEPMIVRFALDALSGLSAAHELCDENGAPLQVIHRDISPQNLMLDLHGFTKIIDFGVAAALDATATSTVHRFQGKLGYSAPEQFDGRPLDARVDIRALGIVLWEMIMRRRMYDTSNVDSAVKQILMCEAPRLELGICSMGLRHIVETAIAREPSQRYASARAMASALERLPVATHHELADQIAVHCRALRLACIERQQVLYRT
jgi:eukaryotic-like serine/threonine-protein kinase